MNEQSRYPTYDRRDGGALLDPHNRQPWASSAGQLVGSLSHLADRRLSEVETVGPVWLQEVSQDSAVKRAGFTLRAQGRKEAGALRKLRVQVGLAALGGAALFSLAHLTHKPGASAPDLSANVPATAVAGDPGMALPLPYSEDTVDRALSSINIYNYAPYQKKQIEGVKTLESALAQLDTMHDVGAGQLASLAQQVRQVRVLFDPPKAQKPAAAKAKAHAAKAHTAKAVPVAHAAAPVPSLPELRHQVAGLRARLKPNTKLDALLSAKWAILMMPRSTFDKGLKGVSETELFGFMMGKSRIESGFTVDAEYLGSKTYTDHARGFVQLETPPYLGYLLRNHDKIKLPPGEEHAFDGLYKAAFGAVDAYAAKTMKSVPLEQARQAIAHDPKKTMAALNAAPAGTQKVIREALTDRTPINFYGERVPRGGYLSYVIAQFFMNEAPKAPSDLARDYGANVFRYLFWQMGPARYNRLIKDTRALEKYDDKAVTAALNRVQKAKIPVAAADLRLHANQLHQQANRVRFDGLRPKRAKHAKAAPAIGAAAKQRQAALMVQQKQLKAEEAQLRKQRAALQKQVDREQATYRKLRKPWDDYVAHIAGQARNNPMWTDGDLRMPREVFAYIRDRKGLSMHHISTEMSKVAGNILQPLVRFGINEETLARMPRLTEVDNRVVYRAPPPVVALRPAAVRVSYNKALKPAG